MTPLPLHLSHPTALECRRPLLTPTDEVVSRVHTAAIAAFCGMAAISIGVLALAASVVWLLPMAAIAGVVSLALLTSSQDSVCYSFPPRRARWFPSLWPSSYLSPSPPCVVVRPRPFERIAPLHAPVRARPLLQACPSVALLHAPVGCRPREVFSQNGHAPVGTRRR